MSLSPNSTPAARLRARRAFARLTPSRMEALEVHEVPDAKETRRAQVDDNRGADFGLP
ncbi:hypothetical protein ACTVCO_08665 [Sanguibacter sp. A247]|uniref:hypothetical protein n=1 Tax=unclassified Sanguibacter TaxID=2645534 RepID=UPI003FD86CAC